MGKALHQYEDLSLALPAPTKQQGTVAHTCNLSANIGHRRILGAGEGCTSLAEAESFGFSEGLLSQKVKLWVLREGAT